MASRRRREAGYVQQAALDATVRFGPELSGLSALLRDALDARSTGRAQARGTARSTISAIDEARPGVRKIYNDAGLSAARTAKTLVGQDLKGLGPVADSIKAGAALEQAGAANRLGEAQAADLADLSQQRIGAVTGRGFALKNTESEFRSTVAKILQRQQDLAQEQGAFQASEVFKLRDAAADRRTSLKKTKLGLTQQERNSLRSAGIDPDTNLPIPNGKLDPNSPSNRADRPKRSASDRAAAKSFDQALAAIQTLDGGDRDPSHRHEIAGLLKTGAKAQPVYTIDPTTKKRVKKLTDAGTEQRTPEIPQVEEALISAALDMYYVGHVSPKTIEKLHGAGYKAKWLPVKTNRKAPRPKRPPAGGIFGDVLAALGGSGAV